MKAYYVLLALTLLALASTEELNFLSDQEEIDSNGLESFMKGAGSILSIVQKAIDILKFSKTSEIKARIEGKGFSYFRGSCTVRNTLGVRIDKFDAYIENLLKLIKVPVNKRTHIREQMRTVLDVEDGVAFKVYDLIFNSESQANDNCNSLSFVGAYNSRGTLDVFYSFMKGDFKLAPNLTVMTESRSFVGGFWSDAYDKIKETPPVLKDDDIKLVIAFFEYIGLEQFADFLGIKVPKL